MRRDAAALRLLTALLVAVACATSCHGAEEKIAEQGDDARPTVVITGANRGLGLELARQFGAKGYRVVGTARKPEAAKELRALGARVEQLDVADSESVRALAARLGELSVDVLVNNAGILVREGGIEEIDVDSIARSFEVNSLGPMRVTQALLPHLRLGKKKLVVQITSRMGSIAQNEGGYYAYRASKAALNMLNRSLAAELGGEGFTCVVLHPGWVRTDMGGPNARLSPEESVSGIIRVMDGLTREDSGRFFDHSGEELPW
ncbi:MAG: SDR family oxidoreductase [Acidobacteriota bacterium]|nr:SDR family oxidoreductase [Acidobacteriota bacterium]